MRVLSVFSGEADLDWMFTAVACKVAEACGEPPPALPEDPLQRVAAFRAFLQAHEAGLASLSQAAGLTAGLVDWENALADLALHRRAYHLHNGRDIFQGSHAKMWALGTAILEPSLPEEFGDRCRSYMEALAAFDTTPSGSGHVAAATWIAEVLRGHGFEVQLIGHPKPVIHAVRPGGDTRVAVYNHYDTVGRGGDGAWHTPPTEPTVVDGRTYFLGVADNKGCLAVRLASILDWPVDCHVTWIFHGEEETGSRSAHEAFPELLADVQADVWLDETGYADRNDKVRLLTMGTGLARSRLEAAIQGVAAAHGKGFEVQERTLNKQFQRAGCPFCASIPDGALYVAVGVNDDWSQIHEPNESIPEWTWTMHRDQILAIMTIGGPDDA